MFLLLFYGFISYYFYSCEALLDFILYLLKFTHFIVFFSGRLKNQRKAVVTTVDKKIPNGILEEQGNVVSHCEKQRDIV